MTLLVVKAMLVGLPFEQWRRILQRPRREDLPPPSRERVADVVWAVDRVSQCWARALSCLPRAIAVRSMMARRHWGCQLQIGVARDAEGRFEAHAWVEHLDQVIIGNVPNLERYTKLPAWCDPRQLTFEDEPRR